MTMSNLHVAAFPLLSIAVHCTTVNPIVKLYPGDGTHVTIGGIPELSVAVGIQFTMIAGSFNAFFTEKLLQVSNLGASISFEKRIKSEYKINVLTNACSLDDPFMGEPYKMPCLIV